jgi:gas vesicle protein
MKGLFWILLGVAIALMIAPRSGEATRGEIFARVNELLGSQG